jgi:hypothetical protein
MTKPRKGSEFVAWFEEHHDTCQICVACRHPTGRCEEDAIYDSLGNGPMCPECWHLHPEYEHDT